MNKFACLFHFIYQTRVLHSSKLVLSEVMSNVCSGSCHLFNLSSLLDQNVLYLEVGFVRFVVRLFARE